MSKTKIPHKVQCEVWGRAAGRCDDGKCQCCDCEDEHLQVTTTYEEINYDEYIDNL